MKREEKRWGLLAETIREILGEGLELSDEVLHYIDSTFSTPSVHAIEAIVLDESDPERDSLLDLIFFPDESLQIRLETMLERENFQKADEEKVSEALFSQGPPETTLIFPDNRGLQLSMPRWVADPFISRLNISKTTDKRIADAVDEHTDESLRNLFMVRFRNARFVPDEEKIRFICRFFETMTCDADELLRSLEFILGFFDEVREIGDIYEALMDKKRFYFRNFQRAVKFEEKFRKSNMEILLLQGERTPHIDKRDALKKIAMIDSISLAVFGRTDHSEQLRRDVNLGEYQDLETVMKVFSGE